MKRIFGGAVLAIVVLCVVSPLGAQSKAGSGNLRKITVADFLFRSLQDPSLYPETSIAENPANVLRLTGTMLSSSTTADFARSSVTSTRTDDSIGSLGGTFTSTDTTFVPAETVGLYVPLGEAKKGVRLGIEAAADFASSHELDSYQDYSSYSEDLTVEEKALPFSADLDLSLGLSTKAAALGFALGYGFGYSAAVFPVETDETLDPVVTSYGTGTQENDVVTHAIRASAGTNLSISRAAELGLSVGYVGSFQDAAQSYVAVDSDGDGRNDRLMLYSAWIVDQNGVEVGSPADPALEYSERDFTVGTELGVSPNLRLYVSDKAELFMGGTYYPLFRSDRVQYERPVYATDTYEEGVGNQTLFEQHLDGGLKSFDATMGLGIATAKDSYLKVAVTYTRRDQTLRQDGTQAYGDNLYSSRNPDHYTELNLGTEPANDALVSLLDQPSRTLSQTVALVAGWSYVPSAGAGMFLSATVKGVLGSETYCAYNLDTRSVWKETVESDGLAWSIEPVAGVRLKVTDKMTLGLSAVGSGMTGALSWDSESVPFNIELNTGTTNGDRDSVSSSPFDVSFRLDFTVVR